MSNTQVSGKTIAWAIFIYTIIFGIAGLIYWMVSNQPWNKLSDYQRAVYSLYNKQVSSISPVALHAVFSNQDTTDLQKEAKLKEIAGQVVVWRLKIDEISRQDSDTLKIETQGGFRLYRDDPVSSIAREIAKGIDQSGVYEVNQNPGTFVYLEIKPERLEDLSRRNVGDWIVIRGELRGDMVGNKLVISPAVLDDLDTAYDAKEVKKLLSKGSEYPQFLNWILGDPNTSPELKAEIRSFTERFPGVDPAVWRAIKTSSDYHAPSDFQLEAVADLNADGKDDVILSSNSCGSGGCTYLMAYTIKGEQHKIASIQAYAIELIQKGSPALPTLKLALHGSACGGVGTDKCEKELYWTGNDFKQR